MDEAFPKDITTYIYKIIHKDYVCELNKEYYRRLTLYDFDYYFSLTISAYDEYHLKRFPQYNYRNAHYYPVVSIGLDKNGAKFTLPPKYFYSSGMSHHCGYKM